MEGKKISFGFKKVKKVEKPVVEEPKDFIECVEEKSIKVVGGEKVQDKQPLIIPMKPNTLITAEKLKEIAAKVESSLEEPMEQKEAEVDIKVEPVENETLDEMAVRELLQEAKKEVKVETQALTVPIPAKPVIDGQKESTLEDYDTVPIQDFGLAMLRGMGWTPDQEKANKYKQPQLRPKGLGLGADKVISDKQKKKTSNKDGKEEELAIVKNSYVKIVAGKYTGYYGKVVSLDEENGRVMVEITVKRETVSLSEFMMQPVTKAEFHKESKVINTDAYEEYKKQEQSQNHKPTHDSQAKHNNKSSKISPKLSDREASSSKQNDMSRERETKRRDESSNPRDRRQDRRGSTSSENRSKKTDRYKRESSSSERDDRKTDRARRELSEEVQKRMEKSRKDCSEERSKKKKDRSRRNSSEERNRRRNKDKSRRDSSETEDRGSRKYKAKSKRDTSKDRDSRKQKERSRRDSSEEDQSNKKQERDRKIYSSSDSIIGPSDAERKKDHKNSRRQKDSSDTESDPPKKDKRDIDKKRKGKKKKRDRDRSPNYKKHRK